MFKICFFIFSLEGEPLKLQCFSCTKEFVDSWNLVQHLTFTHKLTLYKEPASSSAVVNSNGEAIETNGKNDDIFISEEAKSSVSISDLNTSTGHVGLEAEDDDNDNEIIGD